MHIVKSTMKYETVGVNVTFHNVIPCQVSSFKKFMLFNMLNIFQDRELFFPALKCLIMPSLAFLSVTCPNIPVPCLCFHQCVTKSVLEEKHISKKKKITSSIESKSWHPRVYSGFSPAQSKLPLRGILTERLQSDKAAFKLKKN